MLEARDIVSGYGDNEVLHGVTLTAKKGEVTSIIGPNGSGKSTLLKTVAGVLRPRKGRVLVEGNLEMGGYTLERGLLKDRLEGVYDEFPILRERRSQLAVTMSGGEQTMLCIARSLLLEPKIMMLDEPSLGLAPKIITSVYEKLHQLNEKGMTLVIVEQNVRKALSVADYVYVLDLGQNKFEGTSQQLLSKNDLVDLYVGTMKS